jgi:hypothetical protein
MERHPADPVSLVAGIVFAVAGVLLLANRLDLLSQARWVGPLLLIVLAILMLVSVSPWRRGQAAAAAERPES